MKYVSLAFENLFRRRMAVILALVWVSFSVMFTVLTASAADGARQMTVRQIENIPSIKQITVFASSSTQVLTESTASMLENLGDIQSVVLVDRTGGDLLFRGYQQGVSITGISGIQDLSELGSSAQMGKGVSVIKAGQVIVGSEVPNNFYIKTHQVAAQNIMGQQIKISLTKALESGVLKKKFSFTVSGILKPTGSYDVDNAIFVPATETEIMKKWLMGSSFNRKSKGYDSIIVIAGSVGSVEALDGKIKALGYWPDSRIQEVQKLQQVTELLEYFALVLAIISLISSVIGIFITMMSMISARKTEIGLMKAIGATDELIMNVFMGEAVLIGLMGGVVGIVISAFFAWLSNDLLRPSLQPGAIVFSGMDFKDLSISIPLWLAVASPLLAALASLFAGYIPARRAARVDPIDALRSAE